VLREISQFQQILWILISGVATLLLVLLTVRKNYRIFPAFSLYILLNLSLGIAVFFVYRRWGFSSQTAMLFAWGMQGLVLCARALAVAEVCRHVLSRYRGVWGLAWRVLVVCAALVVLYSTIGGRHDFGFVLPKAERSLELAMATVIVALFLFVRYYGVEAGFADRSVAVGFCLYSCFVVLNNTILERFLDNYAALWTFLEMVAFLASLLLWSWAVWEKLPEKATEPEMLADGVYGEMAPEINLRLRVLNENLEQFWNPRRKGP
jgi:hypothetical protein